MVILKIMKLAEFFICIGNLSKREWQPEVSHLATQEMLGKPEAFLENFKDLYFLQLGVDFADIQAQDLKAKAAK